jgi:hypothetical protein
VQVGGNVPVLTKSDTSPAAIANLDLVMRIYEEQVEQKKKKKEKEQQKRGGRIM